MACVTYKKRYCWSVRCMLVLNETGMASAASLHSHLGCLLKLASLVVAVP